MGKRNAVTLGSTVGSCLEAKIIESVDDSVFRGKTKCVTNVLQKDHELNTWGLFVVELNFWFFVNNDCQGCLISVILFYLVCLFVEEIVLPEFT